MLCELLNQYEVLRTVIEFRDRLQQIWDQTSASHGRALEQLRQLCTETEADRIFALRRFARRLPTYTQAAGL
jgi:stearoyl-CoA desaturase (Delta-9 desaturase)